MHSEGQERQDHDREAVRADCGSAAAHAGAHARQRPQVQVHAAERGRGPEEGDSAAPESPGGREVQEEALRDRGEPRGRARASPRRQARARRALPRPLPREAQA